MYVISICFLNVHVHIRKLVLLSERSVFLQWVAVNAENCQTAESKELLSECSALDRASMSPLSRLRLQREETAERT